MLLKNHFNVILLGVLICGFHLETQSSQALEPSIKLAVLDFGKSPEGKKAAETLAATLKTENGITLLDQDLARSAASGVGYDASLNMPIADARNLGAAVGADFFIVGDAQTLRRSPSIGQPYFEAYASLFLVSSRSGKLAGWLRPDFRAATPGAAQQELLFQLSSHELSRTIIALMRAAQLAERSERHMTPDRQTPVIEVAPDDEKQAASNGLRLPKPFRRITPQYPQSAADAEAEATVDVLADIDAKGEVMHVEVARWAGFGLDESTIEAVQRLHFFPAMRDGVAIPMRVLLRYNFRKPPK